MFVVVLLYMLDLVAVAVYAVLSLVMVIGTSSLFTFLDFLEALIRFK